MAALFQVARAALPRSIDAPQAPGAELNDACARVVGISEFGGGGMKVTRLNGKTCKMMLHPKCRPRFGFLKNPTRKSGIGPPDFYDKLGFPKSSWGSLFYINKYT